MPKNEVSWELAQKIHDAAVDLSKRAGAYIEDASELTPEIPSPLRAIGEFMLAGYPTQVMGGAPDNYNLYVANADGVDVGIIGQDMENWYLRVAGDIQYYLATKRGQVVLAQVFHRGLHTLDETKGITLEAWLERAAP